jgi:hypothetical protein
MMKDFIKPVTKTESKLFASIKNILNREGLLMRLENMIMPGLPDMIFVYRGIVAFVENKVAHSGKITMPLFQYTTATLLYQDMNKEHHWYFVYEDNGMGEDIIVAYRWYDIRHCEVTANAKNKTITMDIRKGKPRLTFAKPSDIEDWLAYLKGNLSP